MIYGFLGLMAAVAFAILALPLGSRNRAGGEPDPLAPFRRQLAELEEDLENDVLGEQEAAAIRLEIKKRLVRESKILEQAPAEAIPERSVIPGILLSGLMLAGAAALYWQLGAPGLPTASPPGADPAEAGQGSGEHDFEQLVGQLRDRLEEEPGSLEGWVLLGRTAFSMGHFQEAAEAFSRAAELKEADADLLVQQGRALMGLHGGIITPSAELAFRKAEIIDPSHPAPQMYRGLALYQLGDARGALAVWQGLAKTSPPDAPWMPGLKANISRASAIIEKQQALIRAAEGRGPGSAEADLEALKEMSGPEREAFIESMVERLRTRLQSEPNDLEGWLQLARAEEVLKNNAAAITALKQALALSEGAESQKIKAEIDRLTAPPAKE